MKRWFLAMLPVDDVPLGTFLGTEADLSGYEEHELRSGKIVPDWNPNASIRSCDPEQDGTPRDVLDCSLSIPIYSKRLRDGLLRAGVTGIQFLPLRVLRLGGEDVEGFSVANILNVVDVLDLDRSVFTRYPDDYFRPERRGLIRGIHVPVLRGPEAAAYDILRPVGYVEAFYVSEVFRNVFEAEGLTGYVFEELAVSSNRFESNGRLP